MKPIGEILIEQGCITKEQLKQALDLQKKDKSKRLGEILVEMGMITESDIVIGLSTQFNLPYLPLKSFSVNPEATKVVPLELMESFSFVPIDKLGDILTIATADPLDKDSIEKIEKASHCKAQVFLATLTEINDVIKLLAKRRPT